VPLSAQSSSPALISLQNASLSWQFSKGEDGSDPKPNVKNVSFEANKGELVAIVGTVGSGKSTLLQSIMRETNLLSGNFKLDSSARMAYVEQEPFILSGTIKDNITFGNEYEEGWFKEVVSLC